MKVATPSDQVIVNKSCLTFPAENCTVDFIKVEKENDGDNSDQDFQDSYFNDVNFTGESDGEGGSPPTKRVKKEENLVSTTVSDMLVLYCEYFFSFPLNVRWYLVNIIVMNIICWPAIYFGVRSTPPGCRELRPKKIIKYHTRRDPTKKIKIEKKKETKIRKIDLEYPPDGRDISDRTCRVCDRHVSTSVRLLRIHLRKHENKWKRRNKLVRPPLQCYFCFYSFAYDHSLQNHLELVAHTQCLAKGKFICSEGNCDNIQFHNFSELNNHFEKDHSGDSLFRCALCQWPFLNDEMREVHELVHIKHHQGEGFQCPKCDYKQIFALQIQNHYIKNHTSIPRQDLLVYKCPVCKQRCKYIDVFEEHMKAHEIDKEIKMDTTATSEHVTCKDCGRSFPSMRLLKSHFRVTHRKTQCSKCGQLVITKLINYHMKVIHKEGQPLPCPQCGKLFFGSDRLRKHIQGMHDSERAPKQCHICQKEYQRGAMLDKHLKDVHQVEVDALKVPPKFICSECGKGYRFQGSLEQHVDAKHTKESDRRWNFRCDMCDKSFCRQSLLNKHKTEVHSSEVSPPTGGSDPSAWKYFLIHAICRFAVINSSFTCFYESKICEHN